MTMLGESTLARGNHAVVIAGDVNVPSHLDHDFSAMNSKNYTRARGRRVDASVEWPVTKYLSALGYQDAFRQVRAIAIAMIGGDHAYECVVENMIKNHRGDYDLLLRVKVKHAGQISTHTSFAVLLTSSD